MVTIIIFWFNFPGFFFLLLFLLTYYVRVLTFVVMDNYLCLCLINFYIITFTTFATCSTIKTANTRSDCCFVVILTTLFFLEKIRITKNQNQTIAGEPLTLLFQTPKHVHYTISTSTFVCLEDSLVPNHHHLP